MILSVLENGKVTKSPCDNPIFDYRCQVLCVGAGSAGAYAADSAAREGADVILCEIGENIGGMPVCGNVTGYYYGARGGSFEEDDKKNRQDRVFFTSGRQYEQRQIRLTERLRDSGVRLLCRHSPIGLYMEGERVIGILAFDGEREVSISADITVDATSDGHLIRMLDVKKRYGRPSDSSFVPFGAFVLYTKDGVLNHQNSDFGIMNQYLAEDFSKKTVMAHATAVKYLKNGEIVNLALHTGVREGLTYEGEDTLQYEDVLLGKRPERTLFFAYSDLDRHGTERATEDELFQSWWVIANLATVTVNIPVPMGSVVPKGVKGLVSAGRCISFDTYTQSAVRMNRDMFRMGECIGVAAAMATSAGVDFLDIDYDVYLDIVNRRGSFNGYPDRSFGFDNTYRAYLNKMNSLGRAPDKKYEGMPQWKSIYEPLDFDVDKCFDLLKTDAPGPAIWSCFVSPDREEVRERLYREMSAADDTLYKYNCAIALGLTEDTRALPVLTEIVNRRDCFFFTDNRRSNQFRSAIAVCLIGRLGTQGNLEQLFELLAPDEIDRPMYHTLEPDYLYHPLSGRNFVYFAMLTHTCMAIYKIYKRHSLDMSALHKFFVDLFSDGSVLRRVTEYEHGNVAYEETRGFIDYMLNVTNQ